jgi:hypothetical protein
MPWRATSSTKILRDEALADEAPVHIGKTAMTVFDLAAGDERVSVRRESMRPALRSRRCTPSSILCT